MGSRRIEAGELNTAEYLVDRSGREVETVTQRVMVEVPDDIRLAGQPIEEPFRRGDRPHRPLEFGDGRLDGIAISVRPEPDRADSGGAGVTRRTPIAQRWGEAVNRITPPTRLTPLEEADLAERIVSGGGPGFDGEVRSVVVPGRVAEDRIDGDIVARGDSRDRTDEGAQPDLRVVDGGLGDTRIAALTGREVCAAERGGIGRRDTQQSIGPTNGRIDERDGRTERVDVDDIESIGDEQSADIVSDDIAIQSVSIAIVLNVRNGRFTPVTPGHVVPDEPGSDTAYPRGGHGIEIGRMDIVKQLTLGHLEDGNSDIPVEFHRRVEKHRIVFSGDDEGPAPLADLHTNPVLSRRKAALVESAAHRTGFVLWCRTCGGPQRTMSAFDAWVSELTATGELSPPLAERITELHGDRGHRAIEAVDERRVKQYRDFTVVVGHTDEYIVEGERCDCNDARYNLDRDDPSQRCWHELAVIIAELTDALDHHDIWYTEVRDLV